MCRGFEPCQSRALIETSEKINTNFCRTRRQREILDVPRLYEYASDEGVYVRAAIYQSPQTLQVTAAAERLLDDLGYGDDEHVSRDVTKPLIILGDLHTKPGGATRTELLDGTPHLDPSRCELESTEQRRLRSFLIDRMDRLSDADRQTLFEFVDAEAPFGLAEPPDVRTVDSSAKTQERAAEKSVGSFERVPSELRNETRWVCWRETDRDGKPTKVPIDPHTGGFASVDDPETWGGFDEATAAAEADDIDGIGFVFIDGDTVAGVDLDDVRDPADGTLSAAATDIVETLDSYTEVSPSGTGLHVLIRGFVPPGRTRHGGIELYDTGRFFTVTGDHIDRTPTDLEVRQEELRDVHAAYVARSESAHERRVESDDNAGTSVSAADVDHDVILDRAAHNDKFQRLWSGDTAGYQSHSEADMALCCFLAYHTGGETTAMDDLFRQSGLMRSKWDEDRGDRTYGELTLHNAVEFVDDHDPYLVENDAEVDEVGALEADQSATVAITVRSTDEPPVEEISLVGELSDESGTVRFVQWDRGDAHATELNADGEYRIDNAWVTTYDGHLEVHLNEHTRVDPL